MIEIDPDKLTHEDLWIILSIFLRRGPMWDYFNNDYKAGLDETL